MKSCNYCNRRASVNEVLVKCKHISCPYWIHYCCALKRPKLDINNWICRAHSPNNQDNSSIDQNIDNIQAQNMTFPRTPVISNNSNLNNDDEDLNVENENATDDRNVNNDPPNNDLIANTSGNEIYHEFDNTRIPRSTSIENPINHPTYNDNLDTPNSRINANMQDATILNNQSRAQTSQNPPKSLKTCFICKKDATKHAFCCNGCKRFCHPICLDQDEEQTADPYTNSYTCNFCMSIFQNINNTTKKVEVNSGYKSHKVNSNVPNPNLLPPHDENPSRVDANRQPQIEQGERSSFLPHTLNPMATSFSEDFYMKKQVKKLPEVTDADMSWTVFYESFIATKNLFSDNENIVRIQKAIKDETVKRIGGKGLFNMRTYNQCIEHVNKRLRHNLNFLTKEAQELENHVKIKAENKVKLVHFIDKIRNFFTLAQAYNDTSYMYNKRFLAQVSDVVPYHIKNKWEAKQADIENLGQVPTLKHLIDLFDHELPRLEASIRNDTLRGTDKKSDSKSSKDSNDNKKIHRNHNSTSQSSVNKVYSHADGKKPQKDSHELDFSCWFHKTNDHYASKCKVLWDLDGKTVSNLARAFKICTYCGQNYHKTCPNSQKLKCKVEGCDFSHHSLFCFKRKPNKKASSTVNNTQTKKVQNSLTPSTSKDVEKKENVNNNNNSEVDLDQLFKSLNNNSYYTNLPENLGEIIGENFHDRRSNHVISVIDNNEKSLKKEKVNDNYLLGVLVIKLNDQNNYAFLIDSGSTVSLLEEEVANQLNLKGPWCPLTLLWSGDHKRVDKMSRIVKVQASCVTDGVNKFDLYFRTMKELKVCSQKFVAQDFYSKFEDSKFLKLHDYEKIVGIIGIDNLFIFDKQSSTKIKNRYGNEFLGIRTLLGDYVFGTEKPLSQTFNELNNKKLAFNRNSTSNFTFLTQDEQNELDIMEQEVMGIDYYLPKDDDKVNKSDEITLQMLNENVKKIPHENRYITPLLWKDSNIKLPTNDSFKLAYKRYMIVEKQALKLNRFDECTEQIKNLLSKGYAEELTQDEILNPDPKAYYNPIFFIHPPNKRTRLIWDLAAKVNDKCLNDYLEIGPNLYNNLLEIIFKMRENKYFFKGDIGEMFHQIKVFENDTHCLRFLFRFNTNEKIRAFKMKVLPFGAKCSPVISQFTKNKVAQDHKHLFPISSDIILYNSYVDDIITSVNNKKDAIILILEIKKILANGGFHLLKINANDSDIITGVKSKMSQEDLENEKTFSNETEEKILGYSINFCEDKISLSLNLSKFSEDLKNFKKIPTKREVLQILMSIFDPIGLVQFYTSKLKLLYHHLCQQKLEWDQQIDEDSFKLWKKYVELLPKLLDIKIPRGYFTLKSEVCKIQLWNFGDAGKEMMCGVSYIRFLNANNEQLEVRLIHAKTFVIPAKQNHSIPQLELSIAAKIAEMSLEIVKRHNLLFNDIFFVSDNIPIIGWIINGVNKPSIYVKNRLNKINTLTRRDQWLWVPSEHMPADFGTKENSMPDLKYDNNWYIPSLFRLPEKNWTFKSNIIKNISNFNVDELNESEDSILDAKNYSNLRKIIATAQIAFKWKLILDRNKLIRKIADLESKQSKDIHNRALKIEITSLKQKLNVMTDNLQDKMFNFCHVETLIIRYAQSQIFEYEINCLKDDKKLPKKNQIYKLSPFLDENGVLRARSRIPVNDENLKTFGNDRIFPIILPKNHDLTKLYILEYHNKYHHMLNNTVITSLLKRFHISHIKATVSNVIKTQCYICKRKHAKPDIPMMGSLPSYRLEHHTPVFSYVIIDLAGPIIVHNKRNRAEKRWIFVYSCLTTRGVHLELIEDLSSNSTLLALQNAINLRGYPKKIYTDQGTNFRGAQAILSEVQNEWNKHLIKKGIVREPIEWEFAPAKAPHMQGSVERLVGLVKNALKKMTFTLNQSSARYNDFHLRTILYEITGILNSRPLTMIPIDGHTNEFLTPNYFLNGRQTVQEVPYTDEKIKNLRETWLDIKMLSNLLWKHWLSAYIPLIKMREKWIDKKSPLQIDDIVIVADPSVANSWRLGRIIDVKQGSEDQVRSITLKIGKSKPLNMKINKSNRDHILKLYKEETQSIITRPSLAVSKLQL